MEGVLRVAQLNAGTLLEPDWEHRRHEVVAWLDRIEPDVVCLQEVWTSHADPEGTAGWIAGAAAGDWHVAFGGHPFEKGAWPDPSVLFGSAVLSRWPIETQQLWRLPVTDDAEPLARRWPWELLHARTAGLDVFSMHLAAAPAWTDVRRLQVVALDRHVRSVRGRLDDLPPRGRRSGMPPILAGDANAEPDSDEMRFLCGLTPIDGRTTFWQDAWRLAGDGGPGHTQDWRDNHIAASLNVHRKRIDYVFVGDPFLREDAAGRVLHAEVAFDEPLTGVLASDHRGLVVDVAWPDRS